MTTIDKIMALADEYARRPLCVRQDGVIEPREALRAAIEASLAPGKPVAWLFEQQAARSSSGIGGWDKKVLFCKPAEDPFVPKRNVTPLYTAPQPQPEQERPVARVDDLERGGRVRALALGLGLDDPLYTAPQTQREWVGLTHEETNLIVRHHSFAESIVRATEAKLREKNGGGV